MKFPQACALALSNWSPSRLTAVQDGENVYIIDGDKTVYMSTFPGGIETFIKRVAILDSKVTGVIYELRNKVDQYMVADDECFNIDGMSDEEFKDDLELYTPYSMQSEFVGNDQVHNLYRSGVYQCSAPKHMAPAIFYGYIKAKEGLDYFDRRIQLKTSECLKADELTVGCYVFHWLTGGKSEGVVFVDHAGDRCVVCSNWTCAKDQSAHKTYKMGERTDILKAERMRLT